MVWGAWPSQKRILNKLFILIKVDAHQFQSLGFQVSGPFHLTGIWAQVADDNNNNNNNHNNNNSNNDNKPAQFQKGSTGLEPFRNCAISN